MSSMGMDKSGSQTLPLNTWTKLTSWTVRSGYGSTVITNNTLVMNVNGIGNIRYRGTFNGALGTQQVRVVKNGSTVLGTANGSTTTTISAQTVANGDTLELQGFASTSGFDQITGGAANTFLEYNQTSSEQNVAGTVTETWGRTGTLSQTAAIDGAVTETWGRSGLIGLQGPIEGTRPINWGISGGIYQGAFYNVAGTRPINWGVSGGILVVPKPTPLPSVFDVTDISMTIHTVDGRMVGDFPCNVVTSFTWGREANEVSVCSFDVATQGAAELVEELRPWVHWVTVWHDGLSVWTGPIQSVRLRSDLTSINARDPSTLMWRTRVPVSRTWVDTHTENIANDLWKAMLQLHRVRVTPVVLAEVVQKSFTITAKAEQRMLHQLMDDLAKVGLTWTVVAGRPVLGEFSREPVATLEDCDFMVELERRRDGTQTYNDVRIQGQNWAQTAVAELAGLRLQTLVSMDDMFGSANVQRAALEYAHRTSRIRDELVVPGSASLHHSASVTLDDLVPGKVFVVHSGAISQLMRLDQMSVTGAPGSIDVQVSLVALEPQDEIAKLVGGAT